MLQLFAVLKPPILSAPAFGLSMAQKKIRFDLTEYEKCQLLGANVLRQTAEKEETKLKKICIKIQLKTVAQNS